MHKTAEIGRDWRLPPNSANRRAERLMRQRSYGVTGNGYCCLDALLEFVWRYRRNQSAEEEEHTLADDWTGYELLLLAQKLGLS